MKRRCGVTRVATLSICGLISAVLILSGLPATLSAQTGYIRLEGSVWDPSGNSLAGAALTAVEEKTSQPSTTVSDEEGRYVFLALHPGTYTVTVKAKGYKDVIHRGIQLFQPGTITEEFSFEVSAIDKESPVAESTHTNESARSDALSRHQIEALPDLNRDSLSLVIYQPGVSINPNDPGASSFNGTRPAMTATGIDGNATSNQVQPRLDIPVIAPDPDAVSDVQIITANGKAEYGRTGGAQVTVVSRPGSKSWSKEIYDYARNQNIDANDFFNNSRGITKPKLTRNVFGATVSGPVFGANNLLFLNFEGNHTNQQVSRIRSVLSDQAKAGIFRWYKPGTAILNSYDITSNDPRKLGIDPAVAAVLAKMPSPNVFVVGDGLNIAGYQFNNPAYLDSQSVNGRFDRNLSANHHLFIRANWSHLDATDLASGADATYPGEKAGTQLNRLYGFMVGSDLALGSNKLNQFRVSYFRPEAELKRPARLSTSMYIANTWTNPLDPSFPRSYKTPVFEISDYFAHSKTAHNLKYGATFRQTTQSSVDYTGVYPNITFGTTMGNAPSSNVGPSGVSVISNSDRLTFDNLYNDLLGRMESVSQTFNSSLTATLPTGTARSRDFTFREFSGFVQDDWRILPNLTLNLGVRYELSTVPNENNSFQAVLDQSSQISYSAHISNFKVVQGNGWYGRNNSDFAPRFGFAWDALGSGTLVLRGGFGIYYDRLIGAVTNFVDQNSYGFSQNVSLFPNSTGGDLRLSDGTPSPSQPSAPTAQLPVTRSTSIAILDPKLRTPRVYQFNITLEKRLWGAIWEASYVGTRGKNLFQMLNLNQTNTQGDFLNAFKELQAYRMFGTPTSPSNTLVRLFGSPMEAMKSLGNYVLDSGQVGAAADAVDRNYYFKYGAAGVSDFYLRNYPQFNRVYYGTNSAESWYDALQLGLRKSAKTYNLRAYYTWSKTLDTISSEGDSFVSSSNNRNPQIDRAPSDFDRTHLFNATFNWALPYGRSRSGDLEYSKWMDRILGGWNLGLIYVRQSGSRFSVNSGLQNQYAGVSSLANYDGSRNVGGIYKNIGIVYWFDPTLAALFTNPAAGKDANSGRNSFVGPEYKNIDALLQKKFRLHEGRDLQLRIEANNIFNSVHYANPVSDLNNVNFGTIVSSQGTPRRIQVGLRFAF